MHINHKKKGTRTFIRETVFDYVDKENWVWLSTKNTDNNE
jgi:hypothetical protein